MDLKRVVFALLAVCIVLVVLFSMQFAALGSPVAAQFVALPSGSCGSEGCSAFPIAMYLLFAAIIVFFVLLFVHMDFLKKE